MKKCFAALAALLISASAFCQQATQPEAPGTKDGPEVLAYEQGFDSKRSPEGLFDGVSRIVSSPVFGPVVVAAAIYFGVPPQVAADIGVKAAASGAAAARLTQTSPGEGEYVYTFAPPSGYSMCAIKISADSIQPGRVDRPRLYASGSKNGATIRVQHQKGALGAGRSKVKLVNTIFVVRNDVYSNYPRCTLTEEATQFISICRGRDCARDGHVNRWYPNP